MENRRAGNGSIERGERVPVDQLLECLAAERRRQVVAHLGEATAPVAVADLARRFAEFGSEGDATVAPDRVDTVRNSLHHNHVPKLADANVVTHDGDRNTVEPGAEFEHAVELLDALAGLDEE